MSQKQKRQKFNEEFKADAVSLVIEQGYSASMSVNVSEFILLRVTRSADMKSED